MCLQMLASSLNTLFLYFSGFWNLTISHVGRGHGDCFQEELKILSQKIHQNIVIHNQVNFYFLNVNKSR